MWRSVASNALTLFVVLLFLLGGIITMGISRYNGDGPLTAAICFKVSSGSNFATVGDDLVTVGAIEDKRIFGLGVDYSGKTRDLKAGSYLIPAGASMAAIADQVTDTGRSTCGSEIVYRIGVTRMTIQLRELNPETNRFETLATFNPADDAVPAAYDTLKQEDGTRFRVALAEGVTSWQVVQSLQAMDVLQGTSDIPAEGSLAPDSYEVTQGTSVAQVLDRMAANQTNRIARVWVNRGENAPVETQEEMLILASIIEKETGVAAERGQVASVFANRLDRGMRLQTDPTVIYGITQGQGALGRGLRRSELARPTAWNTYTINGLPPTPIANPGLASLQAAVNPDESDFIFFVADGTGGHAFATNLADHNRNVAKWRQIEAQRAAQ